MLNSISEKVNQEPVRCLDNADRSGSFKTMTKKISKEEIEELENKVNGDLPEYIKILTPTLVKVRAGSDWEGYEWHTLTIQDVAKYIRYESGNLSGIRTLGSIIGDWRPIDNLAQIIWNGIFTKLNSEKVCRKVLETI